ncbi:MAG: hypothetical protein ABI528_00565 [bacterium]
MLTQFLFILSLISILSCTKKNDSNTSAGENKTTQISDTCEGPDIDVGCFFINPPTGLNSIMNIAGKSEEGIRMIITGQLKRSDNTPLKDVIIYAYHTDNNGYYSKKGNEKGFEKWHGHLHGWCKTDIDGNYEIHSIRPARYPSNDIPAHIHWAIKKPDGTVTYLNDFVFSDDDLVDQNYLSRLNYPGDNGVISLKENPEGILEGNRVTILE